MSPDAFIAQLDPAISAARPDLSVGSRQLVVAQWAMESGWGRSVAASVHNWGNVTKGAGWAGKTLDGPDKDGAGNPIVQHWRVYDSDEAYAADWFHLLGFPQYADALAGLESGSPEAFVYGLKAGRYFELDAASYLKQFLGVLSAVQTAWPADEGDQGEADPEVIFAWVVIVAVLGVGAYALWRYLQ